MTHSKIILGIDPGYDRLGVAVLEKNGTKETLLFSDCIQTNKKDTESKRLFLAGSLFKKILIQYKPTEVAIEKLFFVTNLTTGIAVANMCGIIKYITEENNIPLYEYTPTEVKLAIASHGRATKENVHAMVQKLVVLSDKKRVDDEIDAIAVALTHSAYKKAYN